MNKDANIRFDEIHTLEKQALLTQKMTEVSERIHAEFPAQDLINNCPCCNSKKCDFFIRKFNFGMYSCQDCQHIFTNPMPSDAALNYYYNSDLKRFENKFFNDSRSARVAIFKYRLEIIRKYSRGNNLLDIGSAVGIFLDANRLADNPFEITSCDLSEEACNFIRSEYKEVNVVHSDVMHLSEEKRYDCITLWDTLEHIINPVGLLKKVKSLLNSNGILCLSTPNTDSFEWKIMGANHVQLLPPGHVNLYNINNIHLLMNSNGFRVEFLSTPNASLDVSYIKKILNSNMSNLGDCDADSPSSRLLHQLNDAFWNCVEVENELIKYLNKKNRAGNMLVIAKAIK